MYAGCYYLKIIHIKSMKKFIIGALCVVVFATASPAVAQTTATTTAADATRQQIQALLQQIQELQQQVKKLYQQRKDMRRDDHVFATTTHAEEPEDEVDPATQQKIDDLLQQIKTLQQQMETLKQQIRDLRQERKEILKEIRALLKLERPLARGANGEDVRMLQEALATDPDIYPEGDTSGFFGPLTERAVKRFQERFGLEQVGNVGPQTREHINYILEHGAGESGKVPPGLLTRFKGMSMFEGMSEAAKLRCETWAYIPEERIPFGIFARCYEIDPATQEKIDPLIQQIEALQQQIQAIQQQIRDLRGQKKEIRKEIRTIIKLERPLQHGSEGEDVRMLQEALATDPDIYPEGDTSGLYDSHTERAVKRFQERFGMEQVGNVGPQTREHINYILEHGAGESGKVPPGLLTRFKGMSMFEGMSEAAKLRCETWAYIPEERIPFGIFARFY